MSETLADRIQTLRRIDDARNADGIPVNEYRDASGMIADNSIDIIDELLRRLEEANQLFQDVCDFTDLDSEANRAAYKGTYVTDTVADYATKG